MIGSVFQPVIRPVISGVVRTNGVALDPLTVAYQAASGATNVSGIDGIMKLVRSYGVQNDFALITVLPNQNAGTGSTAFSAGGMAWNATIVGGAPWTAGGITLNGSTQWLTTSVTGSSGWTEMSMGFRGATDAAGVVDPSPPQVFIMQGDQTAGFTNARYSAMSYGTGSLSGETITLNLQVLSVANRRGAGSTWTAGEDVLFSSNFRTLATSRNGSTIAMPLTAGAATNYTPSQHGGSDDSIFIGALKAGGTAIVPYDGTLKAAWVCRAALTDAQRNAIDTAVFAL